MLDTLISKMEVARNGLDDLIPGLLYGDTGITVVYYLLEKFTGNPAFGTTGKQLLDNVFDEGAMFDDVSWDAGLAGMGWALEWLVQQGLLQDADTDFVLTELDELLTSQRPPAVLSAPVVRDHFYYPARITAQHANAYTVPERFNTLMIILEEWLEDIRPADEQTALITINNLATALLLLLQLPDRNRVLISEAISLVDDLLSDNRIDPFHKAWLAVICHTAGQCLQQQQWQDMATHYINAHPLVIPDNYKTMEDGQLFMILKISVLMNMRFPDLKLEEQIEDMIGVLSGRTLPAGMYNGYGTLLLVYMCLKQPSLTGDWHLLLFTDIATAAMPKIIHLIVGPKANALTDRCVYSWEVLKYYGYEIRIWNDDLLTPFLQEYYPFAVEAFTKARNHAEAADIARYLMIHAFGGYYMDWDIELLHVDVFQDLVSRCPYGYLVIDPINGSLASEAFAAKKQEPYLLSLTEDIVEIYNNGLRETLRTPDYSGPYRMRDSLQKHANSSQLLVPVKEIFVYDYSEIRQMPERELTSPLIHYWLHSWMRPATAN